jgi:hypothetical protein
MSLGLEISLLLSLKPMMREPDGVEDLVLI